MRLSPNGKRAAVNLRIDLDAYDILCDLAPSKRLYGSVLSQLLRDRHRSLLEPRMLARIEVLEELVLPPERQR